MPDKMTVEEVIQKIEQERTDVLQKVNEAYDDLLTKAREAKDDEVRTSLKVIYDDLQELKGRVSELENDKDSPEVEVAREG